VREHENYIVASSYSSLDEQLTAAGKRLATLHKMRKGLSWEPQKLFLEKRYPKIHLQLYRDFVEGST
jgi:hypothetical protein